MKSALKKMYKNTIKCPEKFYTVELFQNDVENVEYKKGVIELPASSILEEEDIFCYMIYNAQ